MKRLLKRMLIFLVGLLLVAAGFFAWHAQRGLARAERLARFGLWPDARNSLTWYLLLHPHDDEAHLALAETYVKDESLPRETAIEGAARHLAAVPDTSRYGAMARSQEGRLELFQLNRPGRAEERFRQAIRVNGDAIDPYFMLWKLYDLTGRSHLAEAEFWKVYESSTPRERGQRLGEWYLSQFFPATANLALDSLMGTLDESQSAERTEAKRFIRFRDSEPDGSHGYAALGRWFEVEGDPKFALQVLEAGIEKSPATARDPMFLGTLVTVLITVGDVDRAAKVMETWPEPHEGYEYWLSLGQVRQEVLDDPTGAIEVFDKALEHWPGPVDWRTLNRKAACLTRLRKVDEVAKLRERIKLVEELTNDNLHQSLRKVLGSLDDPDRLQPLPDFYHRLGRPREAEAWSQYQAYLRSASKKATRAGVSDREVPAGESPATSKSP